jgi:hypothetical protein
MILTGENKNTGLKTCPTTNLPTINPTLTGLRAIPGHCSERPVTNHLNHDTTCDVSIQQASFIISVYLSTLWDGRSRVQFLAGIYLLQNMTGSVAHSASYAMDSRTLPQEQSGWGRQLTIFHPLPRLRMIGLIPLLSLYAFMMWRETTSPFMFVLLWLLSTFHYLTSIYAIYLICLHKFEDKHSKIFA